MLKLGFALQLTGPPSWGRLVSAAQCAIDDIHAGGELGSTTIQLLAEDADSGLGVDYTMRRLAVDREAPVVMTIFTEYGVVLKPLAEELGVVLFSSHIDDLGFTRDNPWVFRNALHHGYKTDTFIRYLRDYAEEDLDGLRYAYFFTPTVPEFESQAYRAEILADRFGMDIVARENLWRPSSTFNTKMAAVQAADPDVLHVMGDFNSMVAIVETMVRQGFEPRHLLFGGDDEGVAPLVADLVVRLGAAANGIVYTFPRAIGTDPRARSFSDCYAAKQGGAPDTYAAHVYDGVLVIAEALKLGADPTDADSMRRHLARVRNVDGISGPWTFDEGRDAWAQWGIGRIEDGAPVEVAPYVEPFAQFQ